MHVRKNSKRLIFTVDNIGVYPRDHFTALHFTNNKTIYKYHWLRLDIEPAPPQISFLNSVLFHVCGQNSSACFIFINRIGRTPEHRFNILELRAAVNGIGCNGGN